MPGSVLDLVGPAGNGARGAVRVIGDGHALMHLWARKHSQSIAFRELGMNDWFIDIGAGGKRRMRRSSSAGGDSSPLAEQGPSASGAPENGDGPERAVLGDEIPAKH